MAEKSIRIADSSSGHRMAVRDAVEVDDGSNARVLERVDFGSGKTSTPMGLPKRGHVRTLAYTSGGTYEVVAGDTVVGATSAATAYVLSKTTTSGTWAGGDAAGTFTFANQVGTFQSENLNVGVNNNVATVAADSVASTLAAADTFDLTALPAELTTNLLTVGDKSIIVVAVEQTISGGTAIVSLIVYDNESTPGVIGVLPPRYYIQPYAFRRGSGSGNYCLPIQMWDCYGAYKIGFHLSAITGSSNTVKIWGWSI